MYNHNETWTILNDTWIGFVKGRFKGVVSSYK